MIERGEQLAVIASVTGGHRVANSVRGFYRAPYQDIAKSVFRKRASSGTSLSKALFPTLR
jgi:hypothetical protein